MTTASADSAAVAADTAVVVAAVGGGVDEKKRLRVEKSDVSAMSRRTDAIPKKDFDDVVEAKVMKKYLEWWKIRKEV